MGEEKKTPFIPDFFRRTYSTFVPEWLKPGKPASSVAAGVSKALGPSLPYVAQPAGKALLVKGGHCVIPHKGIFPLDVKIQGTRIESIGENLSDPQALVMEVRGKYVFPGVIDPHVHLGIFNGFDTEIVTETRSALLNGVTTLGLYLGGQDSYLGKLDQTIAEIEKSSLCDIFIHLVILNRRQLEEVPVYFSRYGITSFKTYMCGIPGLIPEVEDDFLLDLMEKVSSLGPDAILNIHAENYRIVQRATEKLKQAEPLSESLAEWERSHPAFAEAEAIQRAALLSKETGTRIYFVHVSSGKGIQSARDLKQKSKNLFFETTSPYLTLDLEQDLDLLYKMVPPIRTREDQKALWEGLADDTVDTIGSDHTPMSSGQKKTSVNLWDVPPGYPAVGTHLPSLLDRATGNGLPLARLVEKMTASPAKIFGLYPRKGTLLPGSDADLVIVDPNLKKEATPETAASRSDYCLHQGRILRGWPVAVIKSGQWLTPDSLERSRGSFRAKYLRRI
jgi:dihydropyrimidinase